MENNELITNALRYINGECKNSELTIEDIAVNAGFCTDYFNRIFLNHTGFNVMEYVRFTRLSYAATELRRTDKSILDIGLKYGYDSHDGFTRAFKKQYGKTPSEYREKMKNIPVTFADYNMNATSGNRVAHALSEFKQIPSDIVIDYLLKLDAKKFGYDALSIKWNGTSILTDCDFEENGCFIGADMFFEEKPYLYMHVRHKEDIARYVKILTKLNPSVIQLSVEEEISEQEIKDCLIDIKYNKLNSLPQAMYFGEPFEILGSEYTMRFLDENDMSKALAWAEEMNVEKDWTWGLNHILNMPRESHPDDQPIGMFYNDKLIGVSRVSLMEAHGFKINNCIVTAILPKYKTDKLHELLYKFSLNEMMKQGCIAYEDMQFGEQAKNNGNFTAIDIGYEVVKYTRIIEF